MTNTNQNTLDICNFGKNLRTVRIEKGFTHEEFAGEVGVSSRIIYDYEDGFKKPSLPTIVIIANVLGLSIDSLLR